MESCLSGGLGEIAVPVKTRATRGRTKRPRGALLQPVIGLGPVMCRIGGRLRNRHASGGGAVVEIPLFPVFGSNH